MCEIEGIFFTFLAVVILDTPEDSTFFPCKVQDNPYGSDIPSPLGKIFLQMGTILLEDTRVAMLQ